MFQFKQLTHLLDGKGAVTLHRELGTWLPCRVNTGRLGAPEPRHLQTLRNIPIPDFLVEVLDCLVSRCPRTKCLIVNYGQALGGVSMLPSND